MKISRVVILIVIVAVFSGVALGKSFGGWGMKEAEAGSKKINQKYFCPMHPNYTSDRPGDCPICNTRLVLKEDEPQAVEQNPGSRQKIRFYRNPMNPSVTSPVPAKDEMGMDYVPVYEESSNSVADDDLCFVHNCPHAAGGQPCPMLVIAAPGEKLECPICSQKIGLEKEEKKGLLKEGYTSILISPRKQQLIGVKTSVVEKKSLSKVIQTVGKIAYDPLLYQAEAEYIQTLKTLHAMDQEGRQGGRDWVEKNLESVRTRLVQTGLNEAMIEAIGKEDGPDKSLIVSMPGGRAWVYANIYEYEIGLVKVGDVLEIEVSALGSRKLNGEIRSIDTVVDAATRTVRVRAQVSNADGLLKPDLFVNATLRIDLGEGIAVPQEAIFAPGTSNIVFVDKGNGLFEPRRVMLGTRAESDYEIKSGLIPGERVITNGNFLVDSESRLKAALSSMD